MYGLGQLLFTLHDFIDKEFMKGVPMTFPAVTSGQPTGVRRAESAGMAGYTEKTFSFVQK